jgi:ketosteroid isomerase-like protein
MQANTFSCTFIQKGLLPLMLSLALFHACRPPLPDPEKLRQEITDVERVFMERLQKEGPAEAFAAFAAPDAVIKRENDSLIKGPQAIRHYYEKPVYAKARAEWHPTQVMLSDDGTMAWTYGPYIWTIADSSGKESKFSGIFHTVWKRQPDGSWKYVWD